MTGQYGFRNGYLGMKSDAYKPLINSPEREIANHFTQGKMLQQAGYKTALAGKWQLTGKLPGLVKECGFDEYRIWAYPENLPPEVDLSLLAGSKQGRQLHGTSRYWHPCLLENGEFLPTSDDDYGPDLFHEFVVDFAKRNRSTPFFIYYTSVLTHSPHVETPNPFNKANRPPGSLQASVEYLDHLMGRLFAFLAEEGLAENTLVMFVGDNGTGGRGKGTCTELGVRVPCLVKGPGVQRGVVSRAIGDITDVMPTLAEFAGVALPKSRIFDGRSLGPVLRGETSSHRDWIYSFLDDGQILRDSRWLLEIDRQGKGDQSSRFFDCGVCRDGSDYRDVTGDKSPEVLQARARMDAILAKIPVPKPHPGVPRSSESSRVRAAADYDEENEVEISRPAKTADVANDEGTPDPRARMFSRRDTNKDGKLSFEEYQSMSGKDSDEGRKLFRKWDRNQDGYLSKDEFVNFGAVSRKGA